MPRRDIFSSGRALYGKATLTGGAASEAVTIAGLKVGDTVICTIASSANAVNIQKHTITANTLTVTFSGDPGAGSLDYIVIHKDA